MHNPFCLLCWVLLSLSKMSLFLGTLVKKLDNLLGQKVSWVNFLNWFATLPILNVRLFGYNFQLHWELWYQEWKEKSLIYTNKGCSITTFVRTSPNPYDLHIPYSMQHHFESVHALYHPSLGLQPASCRSSPLRTFLAVSSSRLYLRTATCLLTNELVHKQLNGSPDTIELGPWGCKQWEMILGP